MEGLSILHGYNIRLDRGHISELNFLLRRKYFGIFRARHLPHIGEIPAEGDIIDAGCFTGSKTQSLLDRYKKRSIRGVDINQRAIAIAEERFSSKRVKFEQGDIRNLQLKISNAAMVFSSQVFHHLGEAERLEALEAIYQSLQTSGKLVISDTFLDLRNHFYQILVAAYEKIAQCPYAIVMPDDIIKEAQSIGFHFDRAHHTLPGETLGKKLGMYPSTMLIFSK